MATTGAPAAKEQPGGGKSCPPGLTKLAPLQICGKIPAELAPRTPPNIGGAVVAEWGIKDSHTSVRIMSRSDNGGAFWDQAKKETLQGNGGQLMEQGTFPNDGVWATFKYQGETRQAIYAILHDSDTKVECIADKETAEKAPPDADGMFAICKTLVFP